MHTAFRNPFEVGLPQRHVDDVESVIAGRALDVTGQPERGQHAVRVVVGPPADKGDHTRHRISAERFGAQLDCGVFSRVAIFGRDEQFDLATIRRQGREVVFDYADAGLGRNLEESRHAVT